MNMNALKSATPLDRIIELTFQDAVNGHLNDAQTITREEIGEVYEAARSAIAERTQLVAALNNLLSGTVHSQTVARTEARALLRSLGDAE